MYTSELSFLLVTCLVVPYAIAQNEVSVSNAAQLAEAVDSGATTIILQSKITGLPNERLASSLEASDAAVAQRYADFPEAPEDCLGDPDACLAAGQPYIAITTPLTIKGDGGTLWDMGFEIRRIISAADVTIEDVRLQGFLRDVTPNVFFFIFHNAELVCNNCWVEDGCGGGFAKTVLESLRLWATELEPVVLADDGLSMRGSFEFALAQDLTAGTTSKQTFWNATFSCNPDLLQTGAVLNMEVNPEEDCQTDEDNGGSYRGIQNTTGSGYTCQAWGATRPNVHNRIPSAFPDAGLSENFCRNPDNGDAVWCYTVDGPRWEYCNVPICPPAMPPAAVPSSDSESVLDLERQGVSARAQSPPEALSDGARNSIIAGSVGGACVLLVLVVLAVWCCMRRAGRGRAVLDLKKDSLHSRSTRTTIPKHGEAVHSKAVTETPYLVTNVSGSIWRSSDTCGHRAATGTTGPAVITDAGSLSSTTGLFHMINPGAGATVAARKDFLDYQLDSLRGKEVLGRLTVLDRVSHRRHGGQAVVQVAEDSKTHVQFAMKFYLSQNAFQDEQALYEDSNRPLGKFLPEVQRIVASGDELVDAEGTPLPPCIVMEKGESLDVWAASTGDGLDMVTGLQVMTHIAERLKDLHAAGYVHRDIKPGNVLWLPRKKRWTLIDFGCVARTGEEARTGFTLNYAAPEAVQLHKDGTQRIVATEALDAWSLGILAIEMFTGQPAFDVFESRASRAAMILGHKPAPWEDNRTAVPLAKRFGHLKGAVLALLDRSPSARPSMAALQHACHSVLSNTTTTHLNAVECDITDDSGVIGAVQGLQELRERCRDCGGVETSLTWERETISSFSQQPHDCSAMFHTATEQMTQDS